MTITATGPLSVPLETLRTMVSESSTFQSWVNVDTAEEALDRVFVEGVPDADSQDAEEHISKVRPFALVGFDTSDVNLLQFFGGSLVLGFEADISEENLSDHREAAYEFSNKVGAIIEELFDSGYEAGNLHLRTITTMQRQTRSDEKEDGGRYMQLWFRVEYGVTL